MKIIQLDKQNIKSSLPTIILIIFLSSFLVWSIYSATKIKPGIIPDEPAHFIFSKHFSKSFSIPPDTNETYALGWYIKQNHFLYWWFMGRLINLFSFIQSDISDFKLLVLLRLCNLLLAAGTVIICYLFSREVFQDKWWSLLPVFLLTNTLMFKFLAGGLNYDNLANLLCMASLFFFVRALSLKSFLNSSLFWIICIGLGALTKFTILPLAFVMTVLWLLFVILNRKKIFPIQYFNSKSLLLITLVIFVILGNFSIYGINIIKFHSITPNCIDILEEDQCKLSPFYQRQEAWALEEPLSVAGSINLGYPSPIKYAFVNWVKLMLLRSVGFHGHKTFYPTNFIYLFQILFYLAMILGIIELILKRKISYASFSLFSILIFYSITLINLNYRNELVYGFINLLIQGRYIFPVIGPIYILFTKILKATPSKYLRWAILIFTIGLFIYGGPLTFILKYDTVFSGWFL